MTNKKLNNIESSLLSLWNKNGLPVLQLEVGEVPWHGSSFSCVNFLPKPFTTWFIPDEIIRLSIIWLVGEGLTKHLIGLQWGVNAIRLSYGINSYVVIAQYGINENDFMRIEKKSGWYHFFNPLRHFHLNKRAGIGRTSILGRHLYLRH
jgi:hypothetical protein